MILPQFVLPWPAPMLWPNARKDRRAVAPHRAEQRCAAYLIACEVGLHRLTVPSGVVTVNMCFCPPSHRDFDSDNASAAMKGAVDGIADALRLDDKWFQVVPFRGERSKNGGVIVRATATGNSWRSIGVLAFGLAEAFPHPITQDAAE